MLSLFTGIGGLDLGLQRAGMKIAGQVEIDPYCRAVLDKHWPNVKRMEDVRLVQGTEFGDIDIITGGFPCQDISVAGKGEGLTGSRSGLWSEMLRIIGNVRPAWLLIENVPALRTRGIDSVLASLEELGYTAESIVVGAWAVGAPHKRDRVWIVAKSCELGSEARPVPGGQVDSQQPANAARAEWSVPHAWPPGPSLVSQIPRESSRVSGGLDGPIEALGNAVVPHIPEAIGRFILSWRPI